MKNKRKIKLTPIKKEFIKQDFYSTDYNYLFPRFNSVYPECCRNCSNNPTNGGSGNCACTLPFYNGGQIFNENKSSRTDW